MYLVGKPSFSTEMLIADKCKKVGVSTLFFPLVNNEWPSSLQNSVFLEGWQEFTYLICDITTVPEKQQHQAFELIISLNEDCQHSFRAFNTTTAFKLMQGGGGQCLG